MIDAFQEGGSTENFLLLRRGITLVTLLVFGALLELMYEFFHEISMKHRNIALCMNQQNGKIF
jgi:hypothetical protein